MNIAKHTCNSMVSYGRRFDRVLLILLFAWPLVISAQISSTQEKERCGTTRQFHEKRMQEDSRYANHIRKYNARMAIQPSTRNPDCSAGSIIVPVAVHFDTDVVPAGQEACAISLAEDQILALIMEMNGNDPQNNAYSSLQSCFPGSPEIGNSCIEFCLASYNHPTGYGLTEGEPAVTFGQIDFSQTVGSGSAVPFDANWDGYLNIFVGNLTGGLLGQAAGIPGQFNGEGVVIDACTFGTGNVDCPGMNSSASCDGIYNEGNTLTHEVGHYLGLYHIWGDNSICTGIQDNIDDTPDMNTNYSGYTNCNDSSCGDLPESCDSKDMYMNYMSYAGDACMYMFTSDQSDVIYPTAGFFGFSTELPGVCIMPEVPVASFSFTPDPANLCPNHAFIHFTDESSGPPHSWNWTFEGAGVIPASSTDKNPEISVSEPGTLTVTLIVSNLAGESLPFIQNIPVSFLEENDPLCDICTYSIALYDSYGDGWNGAQLEILLDGISIGTFTIATGNSAQYDFDIIQDQNIELLFSGGSWDSEVSLDLIDSYGYVIFHQGSNPPDGTLYNELVTCIQPSCDDGIKNGNETGIDCGGDECPACPICDTQFVDSGGIEGNYSNNETQSWTLCPDNTGDAITLEFLDFNLEDHASCGYDVLSIFNGSDNTQLLGTYCGSTLPSTHHSTSPDGCLFVEFDSDTYVVDEGWVANIICGPPCSLEVSTDGSDGDGSLLSALNCANQGDTILLDESLANGFINLTASPLVIDKDVVIIDPTQSITLVGVDGETVVDIQSGYTVVLDGLNIKGLSSATSPIVLNQGSLTLKNLSIIDNNPDTVSDILVNDGTLDIEGQVDLLKE